MRTEGNSVQRGTVGHFRKNAITVFSYSNTVNFFFGDKTQLSKTFRMVFLCSNTIMNHFRKNANMVFSLFYGIRREKIPTARLFYFEVNRITINHLFNMPLQSKPLAR
jgi:hypothetical protein